MDLCRLNICDEVTWGSRCLTSPATRVFIQKLVHASSKRNIKIPHLWPFHEGDLKVTNGFSIQRASYAESVPNSDVIMVRHYLSLPKTLMCRLLIMNYKRSPPSNGMVDKVYLITRNVLNCCGKYYLYSHLSYLGVKITQNPRQEREEIMYTTWPIP